MPIAWIGLLIVALSLAVAAQDNTAKAKISNAPLTAEQIAVYRAVLKDYLRESDGALNLANVTEPLDHSRPMFDESCYATIKPGTTTTGELMARHLDAAVTRNTRIVLVDPGRQQEAIEKNDPQNLVKRAVDDHEEVIDKQVDDSVKRAFETGLFTLSEIVFDKEHRHAVVSYSFVCGALCGNGDTLILEKIGHTWKVTKRCGGWVS